MLEHPLGLTPFGRPRQRLLSDKAENQGPGDILDLDPTGMYNNCPKPLNIAEQGIVLATFLGGPGRAQQRVRAVIWNEVLRERAGRARGRLPTPPNVRLLGIRGLYGPYLMVSRASCRVDGCYENVAAWLQKRASFRFQLRCHLENKQATYIRVLESANWLSSGTENQPDTTLLQDFLFDIVF